MTEDFAKEFADFRRAHSPRFYISMPSADGQNWFACEIRSRSTPVFFGSKEDAEAVADAFNKRALARYEQASTNFSRDRRTEDADRDRAAFRQRLDDLITFTEERTRKESELGFSNIVCLAALSLPG